MRTTYVTARITKDQKAALRRIADIKEWTVSKAAGKAIELFIEQNRKTKAA